MPHFKRIIYYTPDVRKVLMNICIFLLPCKQKYLLTLDFSCENYCLKEVFFKQNTLKASIFVHSKTEQEHTSAVVSVSTCAGHLLLLSLVLQKWPLRRHTGMSLLPKFRLHIRVHFQFLMSCGVWQTYTRAALHTAESLAQEASDLPAHPFLLSRNSHFYRLVFKSVFLTKNTPHLRQMQFLH